MKYIISALAITLLATAGFAADATPATSVATHATVQLSQAREIALAARPGDILTGVLEEKAGGSGMRYAFTINTGEITYHVDVDAKTGELLANAVTPSAESGAGQ